MANHDNYEDNGDGMVSACDYITLTGTRYHIDWAGPTCWLEDSAGGDPWGGEPTEPQTGGDPTCEVSLNITVTPVSPVEQGSWGMIFGSGAVRPCWRRAARSGLGTDKHLRGSSDPC